MKRIEDIKKFDDIDTYYEISSMVEEIFEDRVEAHKHLVTANEEIERLHSIIKEVREMLEHKVEFHKNLDFYKDKLLETHIYYNFVACLQDFDEIVEKYKVEENINGKD